MRIPGNFDRWMFNYKEGNLSPEEIDYFETYMLNDMNNEEDVEAWDNAYVRNANFKYDGMAALQKKSVFQRWGKWAALFLLLISSSASLLYFGTDTVKSDELFYSARDSKTQFSLNFNNEPAGDEGGVSGINAQNSDQFFTTGELTSDESTEAVHGDHVRRGSSLSAAEEGVQGVVSEYSAEHINGVEVDDYGKISVNYTHKSNVDYNAMHIEKGKIDNSSSKYSSGFALNPTFKDNDNNFNIVKLNWTALLKHKIKRFYRTMDQRIGYPVNTVNLKDPQLIIPDNNLLSFNPGFAGSNGSFRIGMDYRNQWLGKEVNGQKSTLYFDKYSKSLDAGIGGTFSYSDYNYGAFQNFVASLFYSPKFVIRENVIFEPGIKMSLGMMAQNTAKITPNSSIEMDRGRVLKTFTSGNASEANHLWYKDVGVGFVLNAGKFYLGGNVDNITRHDQTIFTANETATLESPQLYTGVVGMDFQSRNKKRLFSPFISYYQYGPKKEAWLGGNIRLNWFTVGASYSSNNEYAGSIGLKFKSFRLNYQIDNVESEFLGKSFVSHNIGIRFNAKNKAIR